MRSHVRTVFTPSPSEVRPDAIGNARRALTVRVTTFGDERHRHSPGRGARASAGRRHVPRRADQRGDQRRDDGDDRRRRGTTATGSRRGTSERCVGHVGAYRFDTTVPGGARLPTAGYSRVGVLPTHTRRGLLTQMMQRSLREAHERRPGTGQPAGERSADLRTVRIRAGRRLRAVHITTREGPPAARHPRQPARCACSDSTRCSTSCRRCTTGSLAAGSAPSAVRSGCGSAT